MPRPWIALLLGALWLGGCHAPAGAGAGGFHDRGGGKPLYAALCASCHGDDGRGKTATAAQLDPPPGDLQSCNFKYRSTPSGTLPQDSDLLRTLVVGIPGARMPSFAGAVLPRSFPALVQEIKRRCRFFAEERAGEPLPSPAPARRADPARGRVVFEREQCSACHGEQGRGDGRVARALKDAAGRPIRPRDFTLGIFRGGYALVDVYRAFSTGLNGTPMPALPGAIPEDERWELASYLGSLGRTADGRTRRPLVRPSFWYLRLVAWGAPAD